MFKINESEREYRGGDSGPKYLLEGGNMKFGVIQLQPRQDMKRHYHEVMEENFFVLEGEVEILVDEKPVLCRKGDLLHVEPGEKHHIKNLTDNVAKLAFCLSPSKENDKIEY